MFTGPWLLPALRRSVTKRSTTKVTERSTTKVTKRSTKGNVVLNNSRTASVQKEMFNTACESSTLAQLADCTQRAIGAEDGGSELVAGVAHVRVVLVIMVFGRHSCKNAHRAELISVVLTAHFFKLFRFA